MKFSRHEQGWAPFGRLPKELWVFGHTWRPARSVRLWEQGHHALSEDAQRKQAQRLLESRLQLVRQVCEDLQAGRSPFQRLRQVEASLEQDEGFEWRHEELEFVDSLGRLLLDLAPGPWDPAVG